MLKPLNFNTKSTGTALVELQEQGAIDTPDRQYKTFNQGVVIHLFHNLTGEWKPYADALKNKTVYFEEFKDSAQVEEDDKIYAFIALEDIKGYRE